MSLQELQAMTDEQLQKLWNDIGKAFEGMKKNVPKVGIFQLSKETDRRGLKLGPGRYNKDIILVKK